MRIEYTEILPLSGRECEYKLLYEKKLSFIIFV